MAMPGRPSEQEWHDVKRLYPPGVKVDGNISSIVPFGLFVDLPETRVVGAVLAPGFASPEMFLAREAIFKIGDLIRVRVLGYAEGRLQANLEILM